MVTNNFKKIVFLKNMPSNIVDEAIVVLKPNKLSYKTETSVKDFECKNKFTKNEKEDDFIVKEAEQVVLEYIKELENTKNKQRNFDLEKKYRKLKYITGIITFLYFMEIISNCG